ncbi:MAG TPA: stage 0 sporulation family protein [Firmicutes bacterium]|uniref:Stage 0 sporulation family protein n=2 Tax=Capillibacterium thermochitinicola TaxID=2699427 RepID=A0A8J6LSB0_9FIRM|nr:stage 0 sporulation family protein [Capillibacterium thermochitinicola]HHW11831.1 stage 0 sporulation family protein [Bacillota bacterium]
MTEEEKTEETKQTTEETEQATESSPAEAYTVVGVRFKRAGKIYYFDPNNLDLKPDQEVIVETARGLEYGTVKIGPKVVPATEITPPLKKVIRVATEKDKAQYLENKNKEADAFRICLEKIKQHGLEMKLIDVEYTFDRNKVIFYFTADGRVDFRELVKDLASVFRTRIELRQIGVRDEAKMIGGLGPCGRSLCCATFLGEFDPVSIKMAKEQNLSLNPTKISGICGRLMCCLKFESDAYRESSQLLPAVGSRVEYQGKEATVVQINMLKETLVIQLPDGEPFEVPLGEVNF